MLEAVEHLRRRQARVLLEPEHEAGVDRAGPGRHHQPFQWSKTHGGVDRATAGDGGERRTRTEMARHDAQLVRQEPQQARRSSGGVSVRQPVEPVPAHAKLLAPSPGHGIGEGRDGQRRVERGVEAGHRGQVGQRLAHRVDRRQRGRLVQRSQFRETSKRGDDVVVEPRRCGEAGAAVHDAVADRIDRTQRFELVAEDLGDEVVDRAEI